MVCPACGYHQYPRVNPCVITVITRGEDEVLLARNARNKLPIYGLIAGFVEVGEALKKQYVVKLLKKLAYNLKIFSILPASRGLFQVT